MPDKSTFIKSIHFLFADKTIKQKINFFLSYIHYYLKSLHLYSYPPKIFIDTFNKCNLRCELCPTGKNAEGREKGSMDFSVFKKIMDEIGDYLWILNLYNWGEPLLNKELFRMVRYAKQKKIDVVISTNLNIFNDDICSEMINSGLDQLIVSLDGTSQESVCAYQKGASFEKVIENMRTLIEKRNSEGSKTPFVQWRFLVNRFNEHEISRAGEIAEELNVDKLEIGKFSGDMGQEIFMTRDEKIKNLKEWVPTNEDTIEYSYSSGSTSSRNHHCKFLWLMPVIQPNGSVSPCCAVWYEKYDFGHLNNTNFKSIWNGKQFKNARRISRGGKLPSSENKNICYICKQNNGI